MSDYITLYATFHNLVEAEKIIGELLERRLIACANLIPAITSYYRWEGKLEKSQEVAALMKSSDLHQREAIHLVTQLHSYDCPCITIWPITDGNASYLEWISKEIDQD